LEQREVYHSKNFWQYEFVIDWRRIYYCLLVSAIFLTYYARRDKIFKNIFNM